MLHVLYIHCIHTTSRSLYSDDSVPWIMVHLGCHRRYDLPIAWNLASSLMMGCGRFLKTYFCEMTATTSYTGGWPSSVVARFAMTANGFLSGATLPSNLCWPNVRTALPYRPTNTQPS